MIYILRRRSLLSLAIPSLLFVFVDGFLLFTDRRWVGELGWSVEWANGGLYLASSLLCGTAAFVAVPFFKRSFAEVSGAVSLLGRTRLLGAVWARSVSMALIAHAFVVGVALATTAVSRPSDGIIWESLVYPLAPIIVFVTLGTVVAAIWPSIVAAGISVLAAYWISYNAALGLFQIPTMVGGSFVPMVGLEYNDLALVQYLIGGIAMTAVLGVSALLALGPLQRTPSKTFAAVLAFAVLTVPGFIGVDYVDRIQVSNADVEFQCEGSLPSVCVAKGHTSSLSSIHEGISSASKTLGAVITNVPESFIEPLPGRPRPAGGLLDLPTSEINLGEFTSFEYALSVTNVTDCSTVYGIEQGNAEYQVRLGIASWILSKQGIGLPPDQVVPSDGISDQWVIDGYSALADCDLEIANFQASND